MARTTNAAPAPEPEPEPIAEPAAPTSTTAASASTVTWTPTDVRSDVTDLSVVVESQAPSTVFQEVERWGASTAVAEAPPAVEPEPEVASATVTAPTPTVRRTAAAWWCPTCDNSQPHSFALCAKCGEPRPE